VLTDDERDEAQRLFAKHGFSQPLRVARITSEDERVFVVPPDALAALPEPALTAELQQALGRKVWIVGASSARADTQPLR
jgi:phosphoglycolate phosphatase-like HAD superfamily hydrolase